MDTALETQTTQSVVAAVAAIYREADHAVAAFSRAADFRCPTSCGRCCEAPYIQATPLECLPLAASLENKEAWLELLRAFLERAKTTPSPCPFYVSLGYGNGLCSQYEARPIICRLFGFASFVDSEGERLFDPCHRRNEEATPLPAVDPDGTGKRLAPLYQPFLRRIAKLDPTLSDPLPIAEAIFKALNYLNENRFHARR